MPLEHLSSDRRKQIHDICLHSLELFLTKEDLFRSAITRKATRPVSLQTTALERIHRNPEALLELSSDPDKWPSQIADVGAALLFSPSLWDEVWAEQLVLLQNHEATIAGLPATNWTRVVLYDLGRLSPNNRFLVDGDLDKDDTLIVGHGKVIRQTTLILPHAYSLVGRHACIEVGDRSFTLCIPPARLVRGPGEWKLTLLEKSVTDLGEEPLVYMKSARLFAGFELDGKNQSYGIIATGGVNGNVNITDNVIRNPVRMGIALRETKKVSVCGNTVHTRNESAAVGITMQNCENFELHDNRLVCSAEFQPAPLFPRSVTRLARQTVHPARTASHQRLLDHLTSLLRSGQEAPPELKVAHWYRFRILTEESFSRTDIFSGLSRQDAEAFAASLLFHPALPDPVLQEQFRLLKSMEAEVCGIPLASFLRIRKCSLNTIDSIAPNPFKEYAHGTLLIVYGFCRRDIHIDVTTGVTLMGKGAVLTVNNMTIPLQYPEAVISFASGSIPEADTWTFRYPSGAQIDARLLHAGAYPAIFLDQSHLLGVNLFIQSTMAAQAVVAHGGGADIVIAGNTFRDAVQPGIFVHNGRYVRIANNIIKAKPRRFQHSDRGIAMANCNLCEVFANSIHVDRSFSRPPT